MQKNLVITALNVASLTIDSCRHKKGACHRCLQYHISPLSNEPYLGIKMKAIFLWSLYNLSILVYKQASGLCSNQSFAQSVPRTANLYRRGCHGYRHFYGRTFET